MTDTRASDSDPGSVRRLPRGRHSLTREQVREDQRMRLITGVVESVGDVGYTDTSVASIIRIAGISRETFYQIYDSKLACYLDAFDVIATVLADHMRRASDSAGTPLDRIDGAIDAYLSAIAAEPAFARLFLIESYAAGPEAMRRREHLQQEFAAAMADLLELDPDDEAGRFVCRLITAGVSSMITNAVMEDDPLTIQGLHRPLMSEVRRRFPDL